MPGWNLHLTIDWRLQSIMREALQAKMEEVGAPWAVTVAMNPQSGEILGMVSLPSYDNNIFAERIGEEYLRLEQDERRPLINYAIGGLYPPGSVFKMVTSLAGLSEGVITPETLVVDAGPIYLPNRYFPNDLTQAQKFVSWNHKNGVVHGRINVESALALSNDIFFYYLGGGYLDEFVGLGHVLLSKWTDLFGFGEKTGIDLPGEVTSLVPTDQWKRQLFAEPWTTGDSYNMAIGQGYVLATPLQVLVETAALANGGILYVPKVVHHMTDANGGVQRDFQPEVKRQLPVDPEHLEVVRRGMWEVVNASYGTGQVARVAGVEVAGKTGTAEFCEYLPEKSDCRRDEKDFLPFHSWFSAFAPYDNPEIAVVTFVYDGGEGSAVAAPITQKILEGYFTEIAPRPQPVETEPGGREQERDSPIGPADPQRCLYRRICLPFSDRRPARRCDGPSSSLVCRGCCCAPALCGGGKDSAGRSFSGPERGGWPWVSAGDSRGSAARRAVDGGRSASSGRCGDDIFSALQAG